MLIQTNLDFLLLKRCQLEHIQVLSPKPAREEQPETFFRDSPKWLEKEA